MLEESKKEETKEQKLYGVIKAKIIGCHEGWEKGSHHFENDMICGLLPDVGPVTRPPLYAALKKLEGEGIISFKIGSRRGAKVEYPNLISCATLCIADAIDGRFNKAERHLSQLDGNLPGVSSLFDFIYELDQAEFRSKLKYKVEEM